MAKITEKVMAVFEDAKKLATSAGIKTIEVPVLETSIVNLFKPAFVRCFSNVSAQRAAENMIEEVASLATASVVTRPTVVKEISDFMESRENDEPVTLPMLWNFLRNSPNSVFAKNLSNEDNEHILKMFNDFEKKGTSSANRNPMGFGPEMEEVDWHDYVTDLVESSNDYKKPFVGR